MLTPGTRLGAYEITSSLGAGGMGEVYRARDTQLNRDVAIKVLPDLFALDHDRLARFTREAQALAALNHPNIAQIHGLEGGSSQGGARALVKCTFDRSAARIESGQCRAAAACTRSGAGTGGRSSTDRVIRCWPWT